MGSSKGLIVVGAIALALIAANGKDEDGTQPVSDEAPIVVAPAKPAGITAYANDPARGAEMCRELGRLHPGMDCHVEPAANSPHGTPWYLGDDGTSWSVG
jgi:hypothetical protein